MQMLACVLIAYAGVAAAFAAGGPPALRPGWIPNGAAPVLRAVAVAAMVACAVLWPREDGVALAVVSAVLAVSAMATVIVLLAPVAARAVWWAAVIAPAAAAAALAIGG